MTNHEETAWRAYTAYCRAQGLDPLPRAAWAGRRAHIWRAVVATVETALEARTEPTARVVKLARMPPRPSTGDCGRFVRADRSHAHGRDPDELRR